MIAAWIAFGLFAAMILLGGIAAQFATRTFHAALGLGVTLIGVGGLFFSMGNPFLGVVQILVYVGGILTLLVFAVMFVASDEEDEEVLA